jgi:hypothetical protein
MNTTELKAQLKEAQDERRALLATEQNLMERVKALEYGVLLAANRLDRCILEAPLHSIFRYDVSTWAKEARALLEKTT